MLRLCVCGLWPNCFPRSRLVHEVLGRGTQAVVRGGARCASQIHTFWIVVPRPTSAAPRRYLIVVPRLFPTAPFVVCRRYSIVAPRPLPATPLVVRRRFVIVVQRPVLSQQAKSNSADVQRDLTQTLRLIQTQMAQIPVLRAEVYARALPKNQNVKRAEVWVGERCA